MDRLPEQGSAALAVASAAARVDSNVVAIVQAAGRRIGIAGAHVVQAVVVPADMAPLPRRAGGIVGVIVHGQQQVPVVRLENWLHTSAADADGLAPSVPATSADARVVILRDGDRVVGVLVEAVIGLQRCATGAVARLFHDDRPDELFDCSVRVDAQSPPIALLEPARLAALAGVWCAAAGLALDGARADARGAVGASRGRARTRLSLGVFRVGDALVGIDVADIGEILPTPLLRPPPLRQASTRGLCDWRDRLLPVVDIGGLLGVMAGDETAGWICVVRHGDAVLGVLVHEIIELHATELPLVAAGIDVSAPLVRRELSIDRGILQMLDTAALMARCPESVISLRTQGDKRGGAAATSPHTWLVFEAGGAYATRIECVQEIVSLPEALRPRLAAGLDVSLPWRGHAVPVRGLFADARHSTAHGEARLLIIVVTGDRRVAVPIVGVKAMIAPRTATLSRLRVRAELVEVVSTAAGEDRATYEVVDLEARATAQQGLPQAA